MPTIINSLLPKVTHPRQKDKNMIFIDIFDILTLGLFQSILIIKVLANNITGNLHDALIQ